MTSNRPLSIAEPNPRWSVTYRGQGALTTAVAAVEAASERAGMRCKRQQVDDRTVLIEALQSRPWYLAALLALPQRALWRLGREEGRLLVRSDFLLLPWGIASLIIGCLVCVGGFVLSSRVADGSQQAATAALPALAVMVLAALATFWLVFLIGALGGGRRTVALWQEVVARIEKEGGVLAPEGRAVSRRYSVAVLVFAGFFVALFTWVVGFGGEPPNASWSAAVLGLDSGLVLLALILLVAAVLMVTRRGLIFRVEAVLGGLVSGVGMLFLLSLPHFFLAIGRNAEAWRAVAEPAALRSLSWILIGATLFALLVGLAVLLYGFYFSIFFWLPLLRLQTHRRSAAYRAAITEGPSVRIFQVVFVAVWTLLTLVVLALQGFVLFCALQALWLAPPVSEQSLAALSVDVIATALGRPFDDPWVDFAVRAAWVLYGLGVLALSALSVGQLTIVRRATRGRLQAARPEGSEQEALQDVLDALAVRAGLASVRLAIVADAQPRAGAYAFGWLARERYVEVSTGALADLGAAEFEALLAHELAHHRCGQCRMAVFLRWQGRLTFVGDGFALAVQNSFGYEALADRMVESFGVERTSLERCLLLLRDLGGEHGDGAPSSITKQLTVAAGARFGVDLRTLLESGPNALPLNRRWWLAWWLFRRQYTNAMDLHYWHPTYDERLTALRKESG